MSSPDSLLPKLTNEGFDNDILAEEGVCKKFKALKKQSSMEKCTFYLGKRVNVVLLK